jgi:hypothetical protein
VKTLAILLALLCGAAFAHNKPPVPQPQPQSSTSAATSSASSDSASTSSAGPSASSANGGDYSVIALPGAGAAAPLPAGMCTTGNSEAGGFLWNMVWRSTSNTHTDMECLRLLVELERLKATPMPRPMVQILTQPAASSEVEKQKVMASACPPPAKAKTVAQAKASGACKP